jgi:hypothetical protein
MYTEQGTVMQSYATGYGATHLVARPAPLLAWLVCTCLLFVGQPARAATFVCAGEDVGCLIAAINTANGNGEVNTIRLAQGVYTLTAVDNTADGPNGLPSVTSRLTITGSDSATTIVERSRSGVPVFRIFHVGSTGLLTLARMTIQGGYVDWGMRGSGVLSNGTVTIKDAVITDNGHLMATGGGIAGGNVLVTRSSITGNSGQGAVHIGPGGNLTIRDSSITQTVGSGIWFQSEGTLTVTDSAITGNVSRYFVGGGLLLDGQSSSTVRITNSTIAKNGSVLAGGGIAIESNSTVLVSHSSIVDNIALSSGGGALLFSGSLTIHDSTIARNRATDGGGAVRAVGSGAAVVASSTIVGNVSTHGSAGMEGDVRMEDSILAFNSTNYGGEVNCVGPITSFGHNLISDPAGCGDLKATDITGDPGLGDFIDPGRPGTAHYPLLAASLAIDAASDEACSRRDQQGLLRGIDGNGDDVRHCDIGAIEFYPVVNEWVHLDRVHATFLSSSATEKVNPMAAGGTYRVDAMFTNIGGQDICHVAFDVTTLEVTSGLASVLTRTGALIGREGIRLPATLVGEHANLRSGETERYRFTIGVTEPAPLTFFVNVLGDRTAGRCSPGTAP